MRAFFNPKYVSADLRDRSIEIWKKENKFFWGRDYSAEHIDFLNHKAMEVREKCNLFFLIGVGGSNGAARALIEGLYKSEVENNPRIVYAGNGLSPLQVERFLQYVEKYEVCLNVIAKNFQTIEPGSHFRMLREAMVRKYGEVETAKRIIVTGSKNSELEKISIQKGYTFLEFEAEIGGRFSAFSNVGLFPMAVAGINISEFLAGRMEIQKEMEQNSHFVHDYVAYRNKAYREGFQIEVLSAFDLNFREWIKWWVQLFGESEGKGKKGLYPDGFCFSEDLHSMGQFLQEGSPIVIETFLRVAQYDNKIEILPSTVRDGFDYLNGKDFAEINRAMEKATIEAHDEEGIPNFTLEMKDFSEKEWGKLLAFFMAAVVTSCRILEVNPFNQDGVEKYKRKMWEILNKKN